MVPRTHPLLTTHRPGCLPQELAGWSAFIDRIQKGERRLEKLAAIKDLIEKKVARCRNPWQALRIHYEGAVRDMKVTLLLFA
jgi:hypothetical protein